MRSRSPARFTRGFSRECLRPLQSVRLPSLGPRSDHMAVPVGAVLLGWGAFAGTHMYMSHPENRKYYVAKWGEQKFLGIYSGVSFATLGLMTGLYYVLGRDLGPRIWNPQWKPGVMRLSAALKVTGAAVFATALNNPSPVSLSSKDGTVSVSATAAEPKGILRITRHPTFLSVGLWGLGNAIAAPYLSNMLFWAGFPIFWYIGSLHQDMRKRQQLPAAFFEKTSVIPFAAILQGRNSAKAAWDEISKQALAFGIFAGAFLCAIGRYLPRRARPPYPLQRLPPSATKK